MNKPFKFIVLLGMLLVASGSLFSSAAGERALSAPEQSLFLPLVNNNLIDLFIDKVKVTQGTSPAGGYKVVVANRDTLVRVFVGSKKGIVVTGVTGRLCGANQDGKSLGCISAINGSIKAPSLENNLNRTLNFSLPAVWMKPGNSFHVKIDPDGLILDGNTVNNRYPLMGKQPFNSIASPPLNLVILPIEYTPYPGSQTYLPKRSDTSYLTWMPVKVFPVPSINYQMEDPRGYKPNQSKNNLDKASGWSNLLEIIATIHAMEDPAGDSNYYGLVNSYSAHGCANGCITGVAYLGGEGFQQSALGWSGLGAGTDEASLTMTHELGHNFGRKHVLCTGNEDDLDTNFPYAGGSIGQWGVDMVESFLFSPGVYKDYMSYCTDVWTSDYTFWNVFQFRQTAALQSSPVALPRDSIFIRGSLSPTGQIELGAIYRQTVAAPLPEAGEYVVELLDGENHILAEYPFDVVEIADAPGFAHFGFFVPFDEGVSGMRVRSGEQFLAEKFVQEEQFLEEQASESLDLQEVDGRSLVGWPAVRPSGEPVLYRLRLSRDGGSTWQVLALDWPEAYYTLPEDTEVDPGAQLLEVQASDGIHTTTKVFEIIAP